MECNFSVSCGAFKGNENSWSIDRCETLVLDLKLWFRSKDVNTVPEAVPVWPPVRYISNTGQYRCTVSGLPLFFIFIYIYMYVSVYIYYNKYKSLQ